MQVVFLLGKSKNLHRSGGLHLINASYDQRFLKYIKILILTETYNFLKRITPWKSHICGKNRVSVSWDYNRKNDESRYFRAASIDESYFLVL